MKLKIKIITGFSEDQKYTIDAEEAHKAYYLFLHPEERGIFSNGLALIGRNITAIQPDWNATMGWNANHKLGDDDWNQINAQSKEDMFAIMEKAKSLSYLIEKDKSLLIKKVSEIPLLEKSKMGSIENLSSGINKI